MLPMWLPIINRFFGEERKRSRGVDAEKGNITHSEVVNMDVQNVRGNIASEIIKNKLPMTSV